MASAGDAAHSKRPLPKHVFCLGVFVTFPHPARSSDHKIKRRNAGGWGHPLAGWYHPAVPASKIHRLQISQQLFLLLSRYQGGGQLEQEGHQHRQLQLFAIVGLTFYNGL